MVKKNKENEVELKINNEKNKKKDTKNENICEPKRNYQPLSRKNKKRIIVDGDLFSDFHLSKKDKFGTFHHCQ